MMPKYETGSISLSQMLDSLGNDRNGDFSSPDFQRAYVGNPIQVVELLDTVFHGWPLGAFLFARMPNSGTVSCSRPLYRKIRSSLAERNGKLRLDIQEIEYTSQPVEPGIGHTLILDGRQRLQSLLLALSKTYQGLELRECDWLRLYRREAGYPTEYLNSFCPPARIYVNITNLESAFEHEGDMGSLNYASPGQNNEKSIFEWCLENEAPHENWSSCVPRNINEVKNDHILLADVWEFTRAYIDEYDSGNDIEPKPFREVNVKKLCSIKEVEYKPALYEFCKHIATLHSLPIPYTKISLPMPEEQAHEKDIDCYNKTVFEIFRRLHSDLA